MREGEVGEKGGMTSFVSIECSLTFRPQVPTPHSRNPLYLIVASKLRNNPFSKLKVSGSMLVAALQHILTQMLSEHIEMRSA